MKNWKRLLALFLSLVLALSLCACKSDDAEGSASPSPTAGDPSEQPSDAADPDASPDASQAIDVDLTKDILAFSAGMSASDELLTINGEAVPADLFLYMLAMSCSNVQMYLPYMGTTMEEMAPDLLDDTVRVAANYILLRQKAAKLGCPPTDAQVQAAQDSMMEEGQEGYDLMKTAFGLSDSSVEFLFLSNAYYDNVLDIVVPAATDEMLNNYAYQAKHILLKTVDTDAQQVEQADGSYAYPALDAETVAQKKQQAEDFLAQLQAADDLEAKFDELMNEYSEDGRDEEGALSAPDGYTTTLGQMVPEFEKAALALKPGELSGIVESSYGYHIILRGEVEDLDSYADECRQYHLDQELSKDLEAAEITRAPALEGLDVAGFFEKYLAYYDAVMAENQPDDPEPASSDELGPVASDGVG